MVYKNLPALSITPALPSPATDGAVEKDIPGIDENQVLL